MPPKADQRDRQIRHVDAALDHIGETDNVRLRVVDRDVDHLRVKDVPDLVPDECVHRLHVELLRKTLLDAVDDCQLGGPLVGLGQQPARLVEQASILERYAQARGESREELHVGLGERVLAIEVLERDHALGSVADDERREEHRLGGLT